MLDFRKVTKNAGFACIATAQSMGKLNGSRATAWKLEGIISGLRRRKRADAVAVDAARVKRGEIEEYAGRVMV
jgi:hypothetical protein